MAGRRGGRRATAGRSGRFRGGRKRKQRGRIGSRKYNGFHGRYGIRIGHEQRVASAEILYFDDVPPKVSINEAVEISKKYGDDESGKFVNGVLDSVYRENQGIDKK